MSDIMEHSQGLQPDVFVPLHTVYLSMCNLKGVFFFLIIIEGDSCN